MALRKKGECWYRDCCVSDHPNSLRCGKPEVKDGKEKIKMLIQSEKVQGMFGEAGIMSEV